jgi:ATP-dependent Clp protease ATP-binding subunit ClpC
MFERFTNRARHVVVLSQEEARRLHHNYIGTEHILLGILGEPEGIGFQVLESFGITLDGVRQEVVAMIGEGQQEASSRIPFTPRAKKTLELSLREALAMHHNYIGTEHILLGVIREGDGVAAQILRKHADLLAIRAAVLDAVPAGTPGESGRMRGWLRRRAVAQPFESESQAEEPTLNATPAADATLTEATRLAGVRPVGSHHLLLAALADEASAAAKALASLGVDLDRAKDALRGVEVTGTTDEQPEEAGRRQMNIQVSGELVTIVASDPLIVEAGRNALLGHGKGERGKVEGEKGDAEQESSAAEAPGGVIRGADLQGAAAASLGAAWQALHDSLEAIANAVSADQPASTANPTSPADPADPDAGAA